jgi:hypothetical protein
LRRITYILTLAITLTKCTPVDNTNNDGQRTSDSSKTKSTRQIVSDTLLLVDNSLFADIKLSRQISRQAFNLYKQKYATECVLDSGQFISGSGLYVHRNCHEICDTYLAESKTNRKLLLSSSYDAGISNMLFSTSCTKLIVWSSYDGPDFANYYENRAEFYSFTVAAGNGQQRLKPDSKHFSKDWSIQDLTWINDKTIALKTYKSNKPSVSNDKEYKYFTVDLIH